MCGNRMLTDVQVRAAKQQKKHIPYIYVAITTIFFTGASIVHDLHFPTHWELPCYDLHAPVSMEPLQVLESKELSRADTLDDETSTT